MKIEKQLSTKQTFNYKKGSVSLNFELNDDVEFLNDFRSLLIEARKDVEKVISEIDK